MDLIIPISQKNTLTEYMILSGADNRPPMLDKDLVTVQPLRGRQNSYATGTSGTRANTSRIRENYSSKQKVVMCFNCQGEGHMARQCPKPKRKRDATWFREKVILVEAQGNGKVLNEKELEFLADSAIAEGPVTQSVITHNVAYQLRLVVLSEVPISENTNNDILNQRVQEMSYFDPSLFVEHPENEIHSDSNIISYSQYLIESQNASVQDTNSSTQQDALILSVFEQLSNQVTNWNKVNNDNLIANETLSTELERYKEQVKLLEERQNVDLDTREKLIIDDIIWEENAQFADFEKEIHNLKQTLFEQTKEKELLTKTFNVFKNESKEKEARNIDTEIALEKKVKELDNIVCKIDFGKHFVPQRELSDEQASHPITDQSASSLVKIEAPWELSKVSLVNTSLKKLKYHLGQFDNVVKKWITPNALTEEEWGFEHTKADFQNEIIPFLKTLKDIFNVFYKDLLNELTKVQTALNQMEAAVQQYHVDKQCFEIQKKHFMIEKDRLMDQIISQDIMNIIVNSSVDVNNSMKVNSSVVMNDSVNYVEMCNKFLELKTELIKQHNMVEKDEYNRLFKNIF
nr:hypothetical protein [Tanacetum cinerariifolium]